MSSRRGFIGLALAFVATPWARVQLQVKRLYGWRELTTTVSLADASGGELSLAKLLNEKIRNAERHMTEVLQKEVVRFYVYGERHEDRD